jgi:uncharacterized repeat protein (TIGR03803 family)
MTKHAIISRGRGTRIEYAPFGSVVLVALAILTPRPSAAQAPTYETLYSFKGSPDGADPRGTVTIGASGALFGTTFEGGASVHGTVFALTKAAGQLWKETVVHSFTGADGQYPESALVFGGNGVLYGVAVGGGPGGSGAIFELVPASSGETWAETVLYSFVYLTGNGQNAVPNGPLLIGPGGTLYTTTQGGPDRPGGPNLGLVISLTPPKASGTSWTEHELYTFGFAQGEWPVAGVASESGSLFGTTLYGGDEGCLASYGCGTVYELTPPATEGGAWIETTIHTFGETPGDGEVPESALAVGPGGALYGTTYYGGTGVCYTSGGLTSGCGTVFQLTPPTAPGGPWTYSVIYNFTGANGDGAAPVAAVVVGRNGAIYGTTSSAGSATSDSACPASYYVIAGCGIVFELSPPATPGGTWTEKVLHSFSGENGDGAIPLAGLARSSSGVLYGTTSAGGTAGKGTVFAIAP